MTAHAHPKDIQPLINIEEASRLLGDVPVNTLYNWRHQGVGPRSMKIGRHVRYRTEDVTAWIDQCAATGGDAA
jgi:excisionase family DNA binding protein